jgi:hypothetical protein
MTFVAQIDLAELSARTGSAVLPADGALAFFIGNADRSEAAVVYASQTATQIPTMPPSDAPAAFSANGEVFPSTFEDLDPRAFPYWPVDLTALNVRADADEEEQIAAVDRLFTRRRYFLTASEAFKTLNGAEKPYWWYCAHRYAASLRIAMRSIPHARGLKTTSIEATQAHIARVRGTGLAALSGLLSQEKKAKVRKLKDELVKAEARLAAYEQQLPLFQRFAAEVGDWVSDKDPWQLMSRSDIERLVSTYKRGESEFEDFRLWMSGGLRGFETAALLAVATADDKTYASLPEPVRRLINDNYLLPTQGWHQMFGRGVDIQGNAAAENEGNLLLLQLVYDDMIGWQFGDMGAYQFWISPDDLRRRNWSAVQLTFECH